MHPDAPIRQEALDAIQGWLSTAAQALTTLFIELQRESGYVTGVLELGVFHGKYLGLLNYLVRGLGVPVVGVDAFLERMGKQLDKKSREAAQRAILESMRGLSDDISTTSLIASYTRDLNVPRLLRMVPNGFSFVSVDAGHDAGDVAIDMAIASRVLSKAGIAAIDDVYNETTPGVGEGFQKYFHHNPRADLAPFATGGNKVFMCRRARHDFYLRAALEMAECAETLIPPVAMTTLRLRENRAIGWTPRLLNYEIVPFLYGAQ